MDPAIHHQARPPANAAKASSEEFSADLLGSLGRALWRRYNDKVVQDFVGRHLAARPGELFLKTDLFEEALGDDWVQRAIPAGLVGMDISHSIVAAARRHSTRSPVLRADVRCLPFADASLGGVISTSTLDHFHDPKDLQLSLHEIGRVVRPGGVLILTLDNPLNPLLALRNAVPHTLRRLVGMTPYYVGYTCGPGRLGRWLADAGFEVRESAAVLHFPRALVALAGTVLRRLSLGRTE